jgi:hypothetical protein
MTAQQLHRLRAGSAARLEDPRAIREREIVMEKAGQSVGLVLQPDCFGSAITVDVMGHRFNLQRAGNVDARTGQQASHEAPADQGTS